MLHTTVKKLSEILSHSGNSLERLNNNRLFTPMFWSKFKTTSGTIRLIARCCEINIIKISWYNINPIEMSLGEDYAEYITLDKSWVTDLIRLRWITPCSNIAIFPNVVHIHIKDHMPWAYKRSLVTVVLFCIKFQM